jgi:hypothetical protein
MHRLVAAGGPACPLRKVVQLGMEGLANDHAFIRRLGDVALKAEVAVANLQHTRIERTMGLVAGGAALPEGFVLKYKGPGLLCVALEAGLALGGKAPVSQLQAGSCMRIMAISTAYLPPEDWMCMGEPGLGPLFDMAGKATFR